MRVTAPIALAPFLYAVEALYRETAKGDAAAAVILGPALEALAGLSEPNRAPERQVKPACKLLPDALRQAALAPLAPVATSFAAIEPHLHWTQNPNYSDAKMGAGYMEGYAFANVIGPDGLVDLPGLLLGVLILGPERTYPPHAHPAAEVYYVLSGQAEWQRGQSGWQSRPPGAFIAHPPLLPHATRTLKETLLALYCWTGETATFADLLPKGAG